ncbi:MAG: sensor histidine kinase [Acidimicrobiales bacterium]
MATLDELARSHTRLDGSALGHLKRLVASWGLLADLCFADLLLYAPEDASEDRRFVVLGQIRPTTSQTLYRDDQVGRVVDGSERPLVVRAWRLGQIIDGEVGVSPRGERARVQCIPVRWKGVMLGILTRESPLLVGRRPGELERVYADIFNRFARMIAEGDYPFGTADTETEDAPRVGDGVLLLDDHARIEYASPNAVSLFNRIGTPVNVNGARLGELGFPEATVASAFAFGLPQTDETDVGPVTAMVRAIPLLDSGRISGALVLARDVSDLRRLGRQLISKDATIREVHHRVKNNLQTVSSLLRLQARRLSSPEAKSAIEESVRRIRSIALVHETLSRSASEDTDFGEILRGLVRMVEEDFTAPERRVHFHVIGDPGYLPADVATPLAVVLTELFQNAVEHGFPGDGEAGEVEVTLQNDGLELAATVRDDGVGLPPGFSIDAPASPESLGLSIVRTLVTSELGGTISLSPSPTGVGTLVELRVPVQPALTR